MSERIVIVSGCRTAVGKFGGALKDLEATDLGGIVIKEAVKRSGLKPEDIEEVVYGCVGQAAENAFAARLASVKAGIPYEATALTVNRLCSSVYRLSSQLLRKSKVVCVRLLWQADVKV